MCRNIRVLFNFEPPATNDEIRSAALQYVRKVSGTTAKRPACANEDVFDKAVGEIAVITKRLLAEMTTKSAKRDRENEAAKARARNAKRFG